MTVRGPFHRKNFQCKECGDAVLIPKKTEVFYVELNERGEGDTGNYSVTGGSLEYIYSVPVSKNYWNI